MAALKHFAGDWTGLHKRVWFLVIDLIQVLGVPVANRELKSLPHDRLRTIIGKQTQFPNVLEKF